MENLDNIDKETLEYLKQDYEELKKSNLNGSQKTTKCKPKYYNRSCD